MGMPKRLATSMYNTASAAGVPPPLSKTLLSCASLQPCRTDFGCMSMKHHQYTVPYESKMKLSRSCITQLIAIAACNLMIMTNIRSLNTANSCTHSTNNTPPNTPGVAMYLHGLVAVPLKQYSVDCCKGLHRILPHGFCDRPVCYWTLTAGVMLSCF